MTDIIQETKARFRELEAERQALLIHAELFAEAIAAAPRDRFNRCIYRSQAASKA